MKKLLLLSLLAFYTQTFAQNVGIGNPTPTEKLDVTGNINVTGTIKANGVDGSANQVLAKNASNNMAWVNTAHANNTRFKFDFTSNHSFGGNVLKFAPIKYNLNPTNVSTNVIEFTINKSGLYHFDVLAIIKATSEENPINYPYVFVRMDFSNTPPSDFTYLYNGVLRPIRATNDLWAHNENLSFEQYIVAPTTIAIYSTSLHTNTLETFGTLTGHLISE